MNIPSTLQVLRPDIPLTVRQTKQLSSGTIYPSTVDPTMTWDEFKKQNSIDTLNNINNSIKDYQAKYDYWNKKYNETSDSDLANSYDMHRIEAQMHIEELQSAKQYATGEYDKDELIQYANQRASDRFTRNEMSVEYSRLQSKEKEQELQRKKQQEESQKLQEQKKQSEITQSKQMSIEEFKRLTQGEDKFPIKPKVTLPEYNTISNLPYQTGGTSYYDPMKGFYTPTTMIESNSNIPGFANFLSEAIEYPYTVLVTRPEEKAKKEEKQSLFIYTPQSTNTRRETMSYSPKPLSVSGKIEKERTSTETLEQFKLENTVQEKTNEIYNKYSNIIISKTKNKPMSEKEFNDIVEENRLKAEKEVNIEVNKLTSTYKGQFEQREKERTKKQIDTEFKEEFIQRRVKDVLRLGFYSIPVYGTILAGKDIIKTSFSLPIIISEFKERPVQSSIEMGSSLLIYGGGGFVKGKIKGTIESEKISETIKQGKFITTVKKGNIKEFDMYWTNLNKKRKMEVSQLLHEGYSIREVEVEFKPKKGMEKYSPNIKGRILQATNQQGEVIKSIPVGKITAVYKGKDVGQKIYGNIIGEINKETGNVQTVTDIITQPYKRTMFGFGREKNIGKPQLSRYITETEMTGNIISRKRRLIKTDTTSYLKETKEYKGEKLLGEYKTPDVKKPLDISIMPDYEYLKKESKPFTSGKNVEVQRLKKTRGLSIGDVKGGIILAEKSFEIEGGFGISKRIIVKVKPTKPSKSLEIFKQKEVKKILNEYKQPERSQILEQSQPTNIESAQSLYYGKKYKLNVSPIADILGYEIEGMSKRLVPRYELIYGSSLGLSGTGKNLVDNNLLINREQIRTIDKSKTENQLKTDDFFRDIEIERTDNIFINVPKQFQPQIPKQKQLEFKIPRQPSIPDYPGIIKFNYPEEVAFGLDDFQKKKKVLKEQGYDSYVYIDATKKNKAHWEQLNKKPLTKESALSMASREVDNTISARGKIVKTKPKIVKGKEVRQEVVNTDDKYFEINRYKFRDYQQRKGTKTQLPNQFIERQRYRADNMNEVSTLKKAKQFNIKNTFGF
jgi:hypothetical protein